MKSTLTHFGVALAIASAVGTGYLFWYGEIAAKSAEAATLQNDITAAAEDATRAAAAHAALTEITNDESILQNYFVPETGVVAFINDLESRGQAQRASLNVLSVSTGGTGAQPTLVFALTIRGTFDAVLRTVGTIEYAPYDISVPSFSITQESKGSWRSDLQIIVGSVPSSASAGPAAAPAATPIAAPTTHA